MGPLPNDGDLTKGILKMTLQEYQAWTASRLNNDFDNKETQFTGLVAEVGELLGERMRELRTDRESKGEDEILSEIGDIQFYLCNIATLYGHSMDDVLAYNINKLTNRKNKKH